MALLLLVNPVTQATTFLVPLVVSLVILHVVLVGLALTTALLAQVATLSTATTVTVMLLVRHALAIKPTVLNAIMTFMVPLQHAKPALIPTTTTPTPQAVTPAPPTASNAEQMEFALSAQ